MAVLLTVAQRQRLVELNGSEDILDLAFDSAAERESFFKKEEQRLVNENRDALFLLKDGGNRPLVLEIEARIIDWLTKEEGFTQVVTPIILPESMLRKMTIDENHPLTKQVFWLDKKRCLRPMLAPNLYHMMRELKRIWGNPVRIFESGPCFRKETQGAQHMNEFTMLNFVEMGGVEEGEQMERLRALAVRAMEIIGFSDYELVIEKSAVYGETLDIVSGDLEIASGSYGPHFLDAPWGVFDTWVGIGFGLERIAMMMQNYKNIKRVGRSLSYLNGSRLNI